MPNYGMGLGSFMEGFSQSLQLGYGIKRQDELDAERRAERQYQHSRDTLGDQRQQRLDALAATTAGLQQQQLTENLARAKKEDTEYDAAAPLREQARAVQGSTLAAQSDELKRKAKTQSDVDEAVATGKKTATEAYTADKAAGTRGYDPLSGQYIVAGNRYGTKEQADKVYDDVYGDVATRTRDAALAGRVQALVANGQTEEASKFSQWVANEHITDATKQVGAVSQALMNADWGSAEYGINKLLNNRHYLDMDSEGYDITTKPIMSGDKQAQVGISVLMTDKKTGQTQAHNYTDATAATNDLMGMINPASVYEYNKARAAAVAAKGAALEEAQGKAAIEVAKTKQIELDKRGMGPTPEDAQKGRMTAFGILNRDPPKGWEKMSQAEKNALADQAYQATLSGGSASAPPPGTAGQGATDVPVILGAPQPPAAPQGRGVVPPAAPGPAPGTAAPADASTPQSAVDAAPYRAPPPSQSPLDWAWSRVGGPGRGVSAPPSGPTQEVTDTTLKPGELQTLFPQINQGQPTAAQAAVDAAPARPAPQQGAPPPAEPVDSSPVTQRDLKTLADRVAPEPPRSRSPAVAERAADKRYVAVPNPKGLLTPGNIDLTKRPVTKAATIENDKGQAVVVPLDADDGTTMKPAEALKYWASKGRHLGIFANKAAADAYAAALQDQQDQASGGIRTPMRPPNRVNGLGF